MRTRGRKGRVGKEAAETETATATEEGGDTKESEMSEATLRKRDFSLSNYHYFLNNEAFVGGMKLLWAVSVLSEATR